MRLWINHQAILSLRQARWLRFFRKKLYSVSLAASCISILIFSIGFFCMGCYRFPYMLSIYKLAEANEVLPQIYFGEFNRQLAADHETTWRVTLEMIGLFGLSLYLLTIAILLFKKYFRPKLKNIPLLYSA